MLATNHLQAPQAAAARRGRKAWSATRGLTLRSSGASKAGHQRPAGGTRYIFATRALASCTVARLTQTLGHAKLNRAISCHRVKQPQMQIVCRAIHLYPAELGAWLSQSRTTSAPGKPSWPLCVLQWFLLLAGHSKALLADFVPLAAPSKVSLLARSRVGSGGVLMQTARLQGI